MSNITTKILRFAETHKKFQTSDVVKGLENEYSRVYVSSVLGRLHKKGKLLRAGAGPKVVYALPVNVSSISNNVHKRLVNKDLLEHEVIKDLSSQSPFLARLQDDVKSIFDYAFSEMLNNAIEHSKSDRIEIDVRQEEEDLVFVIRDLGVGVFRNVMKKRGLKTELEAIQDLLKGKMTTQPRSHSGEGIFFTSKIADLYMLDSYGHRLRVDNKLQDVFVEEVEKLKGTKVEFRVGIQAGKHLSDVFRKYQSEPGSHAFDKTEVHIKLYTMDTIHISRSQARRVLLGLDKFKKVVLDFDKVPTVGQAFADEVFRVFWKAHPEIQLMPINMNETVEFMINRVDTT